jgi:hypothetical protein
MKINLHIERLVLEGAAIEPGQSHLLQASVASELTRLVAAGGFSPKLVRGAELQDVSGDRIAEAGNNPTQLGQQIAQSVYGRIS